MEDEYLIDFSKVPRHLILPTTSDATSTSQLLEISACLTPIIWLQQI